MYTLSYGLFLLSAQADGFDNACIINTACQVTSTPNRLTIAVNNANFTTGMIEKAALSTCPCWTRRRPFLFLSISASAAGGTAASWTASNMRAAKTS